MTGGELDVAGLRRVGASPGHWRIDRLIRTIEAVSVTGGTSKQAQDRGFLFSLNVAVIQLRPLFLSAKQKPRKAHGRREKRKKTTTHAEPPAWPKSLVLFPISVIRFRVHTKRHIAYLPSTKS